MKTTARREEPQMHADGRKRENECVDVAETRVGWVKRSEPHHEFFADFAGARRPGFARRPRPTLHAAILRDIKKRGLTLVELLVVMVIIAILAGALMGGLQRATQLAREQRTKATIAKIHHYLMMKLETYKTRRITILDASNKVVDLSGATVVAVHIHLGDMVCTRNAEREDCGVPSSVGHSRPDANGNARSAPGRFRFGRDDEPARHAAVSREGAKRS